MRGLASRISYWLNVYDPADVLEFKVASIFVDVGKGVQYLHGSVPLKSHSVNSRQASLYTMARDPLERTLP